jgi:hypothetical protein
MAYIDMPARLTVEYVERTFGLQSVELNKLNLLGPFVISESEMILDSTVQANT